MTLEDAIALAAQAHKGQVDKAGMPYILHPIRVMQHCFPDRESMTVAILHDTVEDTYVTAEMLRALGLPEPLLEAVQLLSRPEGMSYKAFIERLASNPIARRVKIKDLEDNMSPERNPTPLSDGSQRRLLKYRRAHAYLYSILMDEQKNLPLGSTAKLVETY